MKYQELATHEGDGALCLYLQRESVDVEVVARFTVEGDPVSKQRPRFAKSRGRVYTPGGTVAAERSVAWSFRQTIGPFEVDAEAGYGVYLGFFCQSGQRRDVDNMTKLVLDALNGVAWSDDSQVTEISAKVLRWQLEPRTEVVIYETVRQRHPARACDQCGKQFKLYPSAPDRRFCSNLCYYESRGGLGQRVCARCGVVFAVKPSARTPHCPACRPQRAEDAQAALVHLTCGFCSKTFTLRPSEFRRRPNARFCSAVCRNRARSRSAAGEVADQNPGDRP